MRDLSLIPALALVLAACGPAPGTIEVRIYGEQLVEEGIPADVFSDGWAVTFSRFEVRLAEVSLAIGHGDPAFTDATARTFDLTQASGGMGQLVLSREVPGGTYDHLGYQISSMAVAGTAVKGAETRTFAWDFAVPIRYAGCHTHAGVDGNTARVEITIHADHLFYDDLIASEPNVAFELIAQADADGDGAVTRAELEALDIRTQARYQVGTTGITDLWRFIERLAGTVGHVDGEGHCQPLAVTN